MSLFSIILNIIFPPLVVGLKHGLTITLLIYLQYLLAYRELFIRL
ncbi:YqaE/Pmp3 family membrane protein [Tenacibaculum sp. IB213877]|nr:YqaE/Pmp3 family membrane protein [Tenacibaculum sp. IB213877]MDY0779331.1 YqaE/Pmp3 family membrane protein [Tenacibaculum sp. IB213877]